MKKCPIEFEAYRIASNDLYRAILEQHPLEEHLNIALCILIEETGETISRILEDKDGR